MPCFRSACSTCGSGRESGSLCIINPPLTGRALVRERKRLLAGDSLLAQRHRSALSSVHSRRQPRVKKQPSTTLLTFKRAGSSHPARLRCSTVLQRGQRRHYSALLFRLQVVRSRGHCHHGVALIPLRARRDPGITSEIQRAAAS